MVGVRGVLAPDEYSVRDHEHFTPLSRFPGFLALSFTLIFSSSPEAQDAQHLRLRHAQSAVRHGRTYLVSEPGAKPSKHHTPMADPAHERDTNVDYGRRWDGMKRTARVGSPT